MKIITKVLVGAAALFALFYVPVLVTAWLKRVRKSKSEVYIEER